MFEKAIFAAEGNIKDNRQVFCSEETLLTQSHRNRNPIVTLMRQLEAGPC